MPRPKQAKGASSLLEVPAMIFRQGVEFTNFCKSHDIATRDVRWVADRIDNISKYVNSQRRFQTSITEDKASLKSALGHSKKLRIEIMNMKGRAGYRVANGLAKEIIPIAGWDWLRLNPKLSKQKKKNPSPVTASAAGHFESENYDDAIYQTSRYIMWRLLGGLENSISNELSKNADKNPGGRKAKSLREFVLVNLASIYIDLGHRPRSGVGSKFLKFAEDFFEISGWSTEAVGLDDAIRSALASRENYRKK